MNEKTVKYFGYAGSTMSVLMYVSYIPQIMNNLNGVKGSPIQPLVACINCLVWTIYGLNTKPKVVLIDVWMIWKGPALVARWLENKI